MQRIQLSSVCSVKTIFQRWARSIKVPLSTEQNRARVKPLDSVVRVFDSERGSFASCSLFPPEIRFRIIRSAISLGSDRFRREFWNLVTTVLIGRIYIYTYFFFYYPENTDYVNNNNNLKGERVHLIKILLHFIRQSFSNDVTCVIGNVNCKWFY